MKRKNEKEKEDKMLYYPSPVAAGALGSPAIQPGSLTTPAYPHPGVVVPTIATKPAVKIDPMNPYVAHSAPAQLAVLEALQRQQNQQHTALMAALLQAQKPMLLKTAQLLPSPLSLKSPPPGALRSFDFSGVNLISPLSKTGLAFSYDINDISVSKLGKRRLQETELNRPATLKRPRNFRSVNTIHEEDSDRIRSIITFLEKVERPRTWSPEETYSLVQVIIENTALIKQVRYKELHQVFVNKMQLHFGMETKKTRQAFWARHCRIREKLGVENYEGIFWEAKPLSEVKGVEEPKK